MLARLTIAYFAQTIPILDCSFVKIAIFPQKPCIFRRIVVYCMMQKRNPNRIREQRTESL